MHKTPNRCVVEQLIAHFYVGLDLEQKPQLVYTQVVREFCTLTMVIGNWS